MSKDQFGEKGLGRNPLHTKLGNAAGTHPNHPELRLFLAHPDIEDFAGPDSPVDSLQYQASRAHIGHRCGTGEGLAESIQTPYLNRQLHFNTRILATIHSPPP